MVVQQFRGMGWLLGGKGKEAKERRGWEQFWRRLTDLTRDRGIFAKEETVRREDFSVVPRGRRIIEGIQERAECERKKAILLYRATEHGGDSSLD